jgi:hypothetical protein
MKNFLCFLLMLWLPLSTAIAQAMSTQMMVDSNAATMLQVNAMKSDGCHDQTSKDSANHSQCKQCLSCALAMASATLNVPFTFQSAHKVQSKYLVAAPTLHSIQLPPTTKPPIFN